MRDHKQVKIWNPFCCEDLDIDTEISELLMLIWNYDIETLNSCQDNNNRIWLEFASAEDAENFLNILIKPLFDNELFSIKNWLYSRILDARVTLRKGTNSYRSASDNWKWNIIIDNNGEFKNDEFIAELPVFFTVGVRFPKKDYKQVILLLKA